MDVPRRQRRYDHRVVELVTFHTRLLRLSYTTKYEYDHNGNMTKAEVKNKDGDDVTSNLWLTTTSTYTNLNNVATIVEGLTSSTTRTTTLIYDAM